MKKVIKYAALLMVGGSLIFTGCKKKEDDPTPETPTTETPTTTENPKVESLANNTTKITIDASSNQNAANNKAFTVTSTSTTTIPTIFLDVKSAKDMDYVFITRVTTTGTTVDKVDNLINQATVYTEDGAKAVNGGADFSFEVPAGDFNVNSLKFKFALPLVPAGKAHIYTIWFTKAATIGSDKGDFTNSGNRTVVGPIYLTIENGASGLFASMASLTIGDQASADPSYVRTSGGVSTLSGKSLLDSASMTTDERTRSLNGADFNMVSLAPNGLSLGNGSTPYFIGVGTRSSLGITKNNQGTNITKFAKVTLPKTFVNMSAADIAGLATPTADRIKVESNVDYVYITQDGRKGIIHTGTLSSASPYSIAVDVKAQVK